MQKLLLVSFIQLLVVVGYGQQNERPTKSRFWNNKYSTFGIKPGDILVYKAVNNGEEYDVLVTVKKFGKGINYELSIPQKNVKTLVDVDPTTVTNAVAYHLNLNNSAKKKEAGTFWLSKKNFLEVAADEKTTLDLGDGEETFSKGNTGTLKINYKGKDKSVTLFNIRSEGEGSNKSLGVLTDEKNPLIVTGDVGYRLVLKEIR